MAPHAPDLVRRFYDRNTPGFSRFGQGGRAGAIHRAVWGPGVLTRDQAFHFVDRQIAGHVREIRTPGRRPHVVDLGCGVGGSLCDLASQLPMRGTGVTLSPVQARLADQRVRSAGLSAHIACLVGDYCDLPLSSGAADLAYAIESFVHGPDPSRFFSECHRVLRPGGRLIVCDDVRRPTTDPAAEQVLERFREGWHVNTLLSRDEVLAAAHRAGFEHLCTHDLTAALELGRFRDHLVTAFVTAFGWLPLHRTRAGHLVGGEALQTGLRRGWLGYEMMVFSKGPTGPTGPLGPEGPAESKRLP
jgi:SAM-dependent methyltransferase